MSTVKIFYKSIVGRGLFYCSSFLLNIAIARHFEAGLSGSIYYLINIYSLVVLLLSLSMESGLIFFGSKSEIELGKLLNFSVLWTLLISVFLWIFMLNYITRTYQNISRHLLIVSAFTFICGNLLHQYSTALLLCPNNIEFFISPPATQ